MTRTCGSSRWACTHSPDTIGPAATAAATANMCSMGTSRTLDAKTARRTHPALFDEQHLAVRRERPRLVRNHQLELVAGFAERDHRRNHLVAEVFRVLLRRSIAFVLELVLQLVGVALECVGQLREPIERLLALDRLAARGLHGSHALADSRLIFHRLRQD